MRLSLFRIGAALLFIGVSSAASSQDAGMAPSAAAIAEGSVEKYILTESGSLPIVLSAPHGGELRAEGVPERVLGTVDLDYNTFELAVLVQAELAALMDGRKPHLVAARLARTYVDFNRAASQAYESKAMAAVYQAYHDALMTAAAAAKSIAGADALLIDIHGQSDDVARVYRGTQNGRTAYLPDFYGETPAGFAATMNQEGLPLKPGAIDSREYLDFNGGFIVLVYGRAGSGGINAVQLEFGFNLRKDPEAIGKTAKALALAIKAYLDKPRP